LRAFAAQKATPALPPISDMCGALAHPAMMMDRGFNLEGSYYGLSESNHSATPHG
jgi:hypothetical protein